MFEQKLGKVSPATVPAGPRQDDPLALRITPPMDLSAPLMASARPDPAQIELGVNTLVGADTAFFFTPGFQNQIGPGVLAGLKDGLTALPDALLHALLHAPQILAQLREAAGEATALLGELKTREQWTALLETLGLTYLLCQQAKLAEDPAEQGFAFGRQLGQVLLLPLGGKVGEAAKGGGTLAEALRGLRGLLGKEGRLATPEGATLDPTTVKGRGSKGAWDRELNPADGRFKPNEDYHVGPHTYYTDPAGRVRRVSGELKLGKADRNSYQQRKTGKEGGAPYAGRDDGGHLIASMFEGAGDRINMKAIERLLNQRGEWRDLEREWEAALNRGEGVRVDIRVLYKRGSTDLRPEAFDIEYWLNGEKFNRLIPNP